MLSLPPSSPSPYQLWAPFSCCQYGPFFLGSGSNIIRAQVYLHHLASPLTLLVQRLWWQALPFRSTISQAVVACVPEGLVYIGRLIHIQTQPAFCIQPPSPSSYGCRVTWRSFGNSSPWVDGKRQTNRLLLSSSTVPVSWVLSFLMHL